MTRLFFKRLNESWNAEPNAPCPQVRIGHFRVELSLFLNPYAYSAREEEKGRLIFEDCAIWRLGPTNDEGWFSGQCRYSALAPSWGEFYELLGEDSLRLTVSDWHELTPPGKGERHFLFYLRDDTFECIASGWRFEREADLQ